MRFASHVHIVLLLLSVGMPVQAQSVAELTAAVDAAWQRSPRARLLEARQEEVKAGRVAAEAWTSQAPQLGMSHFTNRGREAGRETELSIEAPVWLPAQRWAREALAQIAQDDLSAQTAFARLELAGEVRERLWAIAAAREGLVEAEAHVSHLQALSDDVARRIKGGDMARSEGLLAQQEVLAARAARTSAQARLTEALAAYRTLTGLPEPKSWLEEAVVAEPATPHPRVRAARNQWQRARAEQDLVLQSRSGQPTVGMAVRRQQENGAPTTHQVGVALQIPLGSAARNRPQELAASTAVHAAQAELSQAEVAVQSSIDVARTQLSAAEQALPDARERTTLAREHRQLIDKAFRLGERSLADALRAEALAHEATAAERAQAVAAGLARARLNQAFGVLP